MITQHTIKGNSGARRKFRALGRGDGSGKGSYSTKGMKGQNARSGGKQKPGFEGGQTPLLRRIPKLRGFKNINRISYQTINISSLEVFEAGATVDLVALYEKGILTRKNKQVKLLGDGEITKKITIKVDACSKSAKEKIEKAGGTVTVPAKKVSAAEA